MIETVAVVGATGAVGRIILELLVSRRFPASRIKVLASERSVGRTILVGGNPLTVELLCPEAFDGVTLAIGSTPDDVAAEFIPWAVARGTIVVDESGTFRMDPSVPLVIPEINPHALDRHRGIIASPNCSTTQMVMVLKPLHDKARVRRVVVSTYQAVSGAGLAASRELEQGTSAWLTGSVEPQQIFSHPIAGNLIPQIGSPRDGGFTSEEIKMALETRIRLVYAQPAFEYLWRIVTANRSLLKQKENFPSKRFDACSPQLQASRSRMISSIPSFQLLVIRTGETMCASEEFAKIPPLQRASRSGAFPTISAKERQPMLFKLPNF